MLNVKDFFARPRIMGILNCTPDSFHDGAEMRRLDTAGRVGKALRMVAEGADIVDIGGESTRPGATPVTAAEEISRVLPVIEKLRPAGKFLISIDTYHAATAEAALAAGADIINDIFAGNPRIGGERKMFAVAARYHAPMVVMHSSGHLPPPGAAVQTRSVNFRRAMADLTNPPAENPAGREIVRKICAYLSRRAQIAAQYGVRVIADPGFGFGKNSAENWELFNALPRFCEFFRNRNIPVLVGVSHKSMFGRDTPETQKTALSIAAAARAVACGAAIVRVHDVAATRAAVSRLPAKP